MNCPKCGAPELECRCGYCAEKDYDKLLAENTALKAELAEIKPKADFRNIWEYAGTLEKEVGVLNGIIFALKAELDIERLKNPICKQCNDYLDLSEPLLCDGCAGTLERAVAELKEGKK